MLHVIDCTVVQGKKYLIDLRKHLKSDETLTVGCLSGMLKSPAKNEIAAYDGIRLTTVDSNKQYIDVEILFNTPDVIDAMIAKLNDCKERRMHGAVEIPLKL
jgi:hypothetical protein